MVSESTNIYESFVAIRCIRIMIPFGLCYETPRSQQKIGPRKATTRRAFARARSLVDHSRRHHDDRSESENAATVCRASGEQGKTKLALWYAYDHDVTLLARGRAKAEIARQALPKPIRRIHSDHSPRKNRQARRRYVAH